MRINPRYTLARNPRMRRRARRNTRKPKTEITLHAQPYDITAQGFYFHDPKEFDKQFKKHLPVEEYEFEWIDGPEDARELFEALDVNQASLDEFFELIDELADYEKPALYYLLRHRGMGQGETLDDMLEKVRDEVRVMEGNSKDYVYEYIDSAGGIGEAFSKDTLAMYFDYDRLGGDLKHDFDSDDPRLDEDDEDVGYEYVQDMGGLDALGKQAEDYLDIDAVVRDMELNGDITEFDFAGQTYTTDYRG